MNLVKRFIKQIKFFNFIFFFLLTKKTYLYNCKKKEDCIIDFSSTDVKLDFTILYRNVKMWHFE